MMACRTTGEPAHTIAHRGDGSMNVQVGQFDPLAEVIVGRDCEFSDVRWDVGEAVIEAALRRDLGGNVIVLHADSASPLDGVTQISSDLRRNRGERPPAAIYMASDGGYALAMLDDGEFWFCVEVEDRPNMRWLRPVPIEGYYFVDPFEGIVTRGLVRSPDFWEKTAPGPRP